jgi:DNA-binding transcriptional ArsR family regulator
MSLLPSSPDVSPDSDPRLVGLDSEEADELMAALSSETARELLSALHEDPAPPGELADRVDTSLQNAQYHLEKLENAGAIEVVGTAYSEKGREMAVYGPADSPLVIYAGEQERASGLRAALSRLFGGVLALVVGSLAIQELFGQSILRSAREDAGTGGGDAATASPAPDGDDDGAVADNGNGTGDGNGNGAAGDDGADGEANVTDQTTGEPAGTATEEDVGIATNGSDGTATPTEGATGTPESAATKSRAADGTPTETPEPTGTPMETPKPAATEAEQPVTDAPTPTETPFATESGGGGPLDVLDGLLDGLLAGGLPPGLAFFIGGLTVLSVVVVMTYLRAQP